MATLVGIEPKKMSKVALRDIASRVWRDGGLTIRLLQHIRYLERELDRKGK